jgi:hypothetical protein
MTAMSALPCPSSAALRRTGRATRLVPALSPPTALNVS